jgi:hypothetical protein
LPGRSARYMARRGRPARPRRPRSARSSTLSLSRARRLALRPSIWYVEGGCVLTNDQAAMRRAHCAIILVGTIPILPFSC